MATGLPTAAMAMECSAPTTSDEPPSNLSLMHACERCRTSKTACNDERPCHRCKRLGLQCSSEGEAPRKRACTSCYEAKTACDSISTEKCSRCLSFNIPCIPRPRGPPAQRTPSRKRARSGPPIVYVSDGNQQAFKVVDAVSVRSNPSSPMLLSNMASIAVSLLDLARRPTQAETSTVLASVVLPPAKHGGIRPRCAHVSGCTSAAMFRGMCWVHADADWKVATAKRDCIEHTKTRTLALLEQAELAMAKFGCSRADEECKLTVSQGSLRNEKAKAPPSAQGALSSSSSAAGPSSAAAPPSAVYADGEQPPAGRGKKRSREAAAVPPLEAPRAVAVPHVVPAQYLSPHAARGRADACLLAFGPPMLTSTTGRLFC